MKSISIHPRVRVHGRAGSGVCVLLFVCLEGGVCSLATVVVMVVVVWGFHQHSLLFLVCLCWNDPVPIALVCVFFLKPHRCGHAVVVFSSTAQIFIQCHVQPYQHVGVWR